MGGGGGGGKTIGLKIGVVPLCWPHSSRQADEKVLHRNVLRLRNSASDFLEFNL